MKEFYWVHVQPENTVIYGPKYLVYDHFPIVPHKILLDYHKANEGGNSYFIRTIKLSDEERALINIMGIEPKFDYVVVK